MQVSISGMIKRNHSPAKCLAESSTLEMYIRAPTVCSRERPEEQEDERDPVPVSIGSQGGKRRDKTALLQQSTSLGKSGRSICFVDG